MAGLSYITSTVLTTHNPLPQSNNYYFFVLRNKISQNTFDETNTTFSL